MSSTILMAIVLVVMWLVVLVPMFVRGEEERADVRSTDRFASAMRVLSRRSRAGGGVAGSSRPAGAVRYVDGASPVRTAARAAMLRRRRRTLAVLTTTALLAVPAALVVSAWLWPVQVTATLLLGGYVGWLRQQVRRERQRRSKRAAMFAAAARSAGTDHLVRRGARVAAAGVADAGAAAADRSWRPVPVPAPTYVTAPVVRRRTESTVDLDDDDLSFTDLDSADEDLPRAVNQ